MSRKSIEEQLGVKGEGMQSFIDSVGEDEFVLLSRLKLEMEDTRQAKEKLSLLVQRCEDPEDQFSNYSRRN